MREVYQGQLGELTEELASMATLVTSAMEHATQALLEADLTLAEQVIDEDVRVDEARARCEEQAFGLLALQAPVAGDLRGVVSAIHASEDLQRMGALALHVAKAARRRHPQQVLPAEVRSYFAEMGGIAVTLARQVGDVIKNQDVEIASGLEQADDKMDDLHRHLFTLMMRPDWSYGVSAAVDVALLGRFYERFADHTVSVGRRVVFIATGKLPD
jgi:phosphate transport system protein